jgi:segregation and condensation protein B
MGQGDEMDRAEGTEMGEGMETLDAFEGVEEVDGAGELGDAEVRQRPPLNRSNHAVGEAMKTLSQPARLEAILYLKGRPLSLHELARLSGMDPEDVEMALITLMADYAHRDTALEIYQDQQTYSLQLRQGLSDLVQVLLPVDLSTAALRTLATIALKKRILQSDLVELRGSGAYDHIKELLAQNFIERKRQSDGRSFWLTLSEKFHRTFALDSQGPAQSSRSDDLQQDNAA